MAAGIQLRFVLVKPSNALNMGAAARALANFGVADLTVVAPYQPRWRQARSAIYGGRLLHKAPAKTLQEAIADCHLVLGTASAHNRALRRTTLTLPAAAPWLKRRLPKGGRVAILFGSEQSGLNNESLDHCHAVLRIPTDPEAPSMNLGQAVAVTAYGLLHSGLERSVEEPDEELVDGRQLEGLVETAMRAMEKAKVNAHMKEGARRQKFRRGLLKWRMSRSDASWLRGLLDRLTAG